MLDTSTHYIRAKWHPWFFIIIFSGLLLIDQITKAWVRFTLTPHQSPGYPWPGVFEITLTYNEGVAWGMLQGSGIYFIPLALITAGGCIFYSLRNPQLTNLIHLTFALLAAGAIGNLIDRLFLGKVTDMFWFRLINFPVFNVADSCITISAVLLIVQALFSKSSENSI